MAITLSRPSPCDLFPCVYIKKYVFSIIPTIIDKQNSITPADITFSFKATLQKVVINRTICLRLLFCQNGAQFEIFYAEL